MAERSAFWNGTVTGDATEAPYDANTEFANYVRQTVGLGNTRANAGVVLGNGSESTQLDSLQVTQNSPAGMSVLLNIGTAIVHGTTYENDSALTLSIAANGSGSARIDTIVLRKSWVGQTVRAAVLAGTPAGSPVPPTLTQSDGTTWEIPIADIAVANGAVSITNANITSRAIYSNASDGVYLDRISNGTASTNVTGDALRWLTTREVFTGGAMSIAAGVQSGRTASAAYGRILNRGIGYVLTDAAVTAGQYGHMSSTARTVTPTNSIRVNTFCRFLETTSGAGLALAFIDAGIRPQFGGIGQTTLSVAGAALAVTGLPTVNGNGGVMIIEVMIRTAVAAVSDIVNLRLGTTSTLDTTAADYYSYANFTANSTPADTAVQNLGATAGILFAAPGNTAPAGVYGHWIFNIGFAYVTAVAIPKIITGHGFFSTTNVNGGLSNALVGGRWDTGGSASVNQISIVSNSGANIAASSYVNVYFKDTDA